MTQGLLFLARDLMSYFLCGFWASLSEVTAWGRSWGASLNSAFAGLGINFSKNTS